MQRVLTTSLNSSAFPTTSPGEIELEFRKDWGKLEAQYLNVRKDLQTRTVVSRNGGNLSRVEVVKGVVQGIDVYDVSSPRAQ